MTSQSQADRKDEFRRYLERKKVIEVLTKTLTDLFESDSRPDDPLLYLHSKIGEHVKKSVASGSAATPPSSHEKKMEQPIASSAPNTVTSSAVPPSATD